ncbi:dynamin family protein [Corynebacterium aquilae]|uniref:dynamin family protein n=1 Tax=Corynebacterium aquilae TaxID=203263 RepID=UPI0012EE6353|nr:dynamin family protein [Corynebacterium aquilae]
MTTTTPTEFRSRAKAQLEGMLDGALSKLGREDVVKRTWAKFDSSSQAKTVVIVGEVGRGKSSLANALVGRAGASPESVDSATTIPIALVPSEAPSPTAQLWSADGMVEVAHTELSHFIDERAEANSLTASGPESFTPTRVTVPVGVTPMDDVVVIDTPGVGGLVPAHAELAQQALEQACVLVIAVDASTPITAPEMSFIKQAGAHADSIIVAVTKIDKNTTRWREILADNKRIISENMARSVPVLPVSSLLAVRDTPGAEEISGIIPLREAIKDRFRTAELFPTVNALRTAVEELRVARSQFQSKLTTITEGAAAVPSLEADLARLNSLKKDAEQWEQYLQRDLTLIRQGAMSTLDSELESIRSDWTNRINSHGMAVLRKNPQHFTAQMEKDFQKAVLTSVEQFASELKTTIIEPRFDSPDAWDEIQASISAQLQAQQPTHAEVKKKSEGIFDPMMLMMGFSGGSAIGGILASVVSFTGVGLAAGAGWIAINVGFRAMRAGKNNLLAWMNTTSNSTRVFTNRILDNTLAQARPAIVIRYREHLKTSIEQTQRAIRDAEAAATRDKKRREEKIASLSKNIRIIDTRITKAEELIDEINAYAATVASTTPSQELAC